MRKYSPVCGVQLRAVFTDHCLLFFAVDFFGSHERPRLLDSVSFHSCRPCASVSGRASGSNYSKHRRPLCLQVGALCFPPLTRMISNNSNISSLQHIRQGTNMHLFLFLIVATFDNISNRASYPYYIVRSFMVCACRSRSW